MLDVQCNGKGMVLRVTLLAAGFVVGPNGASIHQIEAVAGVNIRSFNLPKDAVVRRATRKFHIDGAGPKVQAAVDIIHSAVQLYKFLAEGACDGKKVKRMHLVRGVLFRYEPPPRLRVPYAAQVEYSAEEVPLVRQQRSYKTTAAISQVRSRLAQRDEAMMRARLHDYRCGRAPQGPAWARDGGADHGGPPIEPVPVQYHGDAGPNLEALAGAGFNSEGYGFGFAGPYDGPEPEYDPAAYAPPPPALGGLPRSASGPWHRRGLRARARRRGPSSGAGPRRRSLCRSTSSLLGLSPTPCPSRRARTSGAPTPAATFRGPGPPRLRARRRRGRRPRPLPTRPTSSSRACGWRASSAGPAPPPTTSSSPASCAPSPPTPPTPCLTATPRRTGSPT